MKTYCSVCNEFLGRFKCPACKVAFCWKCWTAHLTAQACDYGKAKVLDLL